MRGLELGKDSIHKVSLFEGGGEGLEIELFAC